MRFPILSSLGAVLLAASVATAGPVGTDLMNKPLKVRWSAKAGKDAGPVDMLSTGERLIAVSWSGELYAFNTTTGKRVWKKKPRKPHDYQHGEIALAGGVVVWRNAEDTQLLGLDPQTGKQKWAIELEAPASRLTTCEGSRLVVVSHRGADADGKSTLLARAIDPVDGTTRWRTPVPSELAGDGGGSVFAYTFSGRGRLFNGLTAVSCATGEARTLTFPVKKPYLTFLDAGGDTLATAHGIHGGSFTEVCMTSIKNPNNVTCTAIEGGQSVDGGLVQADIDRLYVSSTSALIAYDLETKQPVGRSTPGNAGISPANAGAVLLSAVGGTGMDDFAFLLDPVDMRRVGTVALSKAPTQLVADSKMGYVAAYDGSIKAFELPLPGPKPLLEEVVQVSTSASPGVEKVEDLGWQVSSIIDAHPKKGRSSGMKGDGTVDAVAWLGDTGRLAVGGNDDKVRVIDTATGKRLWLSKSMRKDVIHVESCPNGALAAVNYRGDLVVYSPKGKRKYTPSNMVKMGEGWNFGVNADCSVLVSTDLDDFVKGYTRSSKTGKLNPEYFQVIPRARVGFDARGMKVRANRIVVPTKEGLKVLDVTQPIADLFSTDGAPVLKVMANVAESAGGTRVVDNLLQGHGGALTQTWMVSESRILREYCNTQQCTVVISDLDGAQAQTFHFDIGGGVWVPSVPSHLEVSPDGRWIFFARRGLEAVLVDTNTGAQQPIRHIARSTGQAAPATDAPEAAFAPDGSLALGMYPKPWQVTLLRLSGGGSRR